MDPAALWHGMTTFAAWLGVPALALAFFNTAAKFKSDERLQQQKAAFEVQLAELKAEQSRSLEALKAELSEQTQQRLEAYKVPLQQQLDSFRSGLEQNRDESAARRDYEYEARQRLYTQCEPLVFQLIERSQVAMERIAVLASRARAGELSEKNNLLDEEYFHDATVYRLFAPLVVFTLIQRRLTAVDLSLDSRIHAIYQLGRLLYRAMNEDKRLAKVDPRLGYQPESTQPNPRLPAVYKKQGVVAGNLEAIMQLMIVGNSDNAERCLNFSAFSATVRPKKAGSTAKSDDFALGVIRELFEGFHPDRRPVLWRVLIAQLHVYAAICRLAEIRRDDSAEVSAAALLVPIEGDARRKYSWRPEGDGVTDGVPLDQPFDVAYQYLTTPNA